MGRLVGIRLPDRQRPEAVSGFAVQAGETLHLSHFFSLRALWTLGHFKFHFLSFFECLKTVTLNSTVVNEDV